MRIVIKIGTSSLVNEDCTLREEMLTSIAKATKKLMDSGNEVAVVTSGAVGCGKSIFRYALEKGLYIKEKDFCNKKEYETIEKTILSGVGQVSLMSHYLIEFLKIGLIPEQSLVAGRRDLADSTLQGNIEKCFQLGIVPIINANDTVYSKEVKVDENKRFDDNDELSAELAKKIKADALFLVTNVEGYYDKDGKVVPEIAMNNIDEFITITDETTSTGGTGGMISKLKAGKIAECDTYIIQNTQIENIVRVLQEERIGTRICKKPSFLNSLRVLQGNAEEKIESMQCQH